MTEEQAKPLEVRSDLSAQNLSVVQDCVLCIQPDPPTKRCPKCGHGNTSGSIIFSGEAMGDLAGEYCGRCLAEWTARHVPKMVEIGT